MPQFEFHDLKLAHGSLPQPFYVPDATHGFVRSLSVADVEQTETQALMMNAFCLMQKPGATTIKSLGGLHQMMGWHKPILTDSGGFQTLSMIRQNAKFGSISNGGVTFRPEDGRDKIMLTPEKVIQRQLAFGSDIVYCLDDCTHVDGDESEQKSSVERTIAWAKRCKEEFVRVSEEKGLAEEKRPLLFAVVQGGGSLELRKRCAEELLAVGFDGYGFGGWPLDAKKQLLTEILEYTRGLIPSHFPMHALGIGHPANIERCVSLGYGIFDSAMPTKDARNGRLYRFESEDVDSGLGWFSFLYIEDSKHSKSSEPVSAQCDQECCRRHSIGYLHHLYEVKDPLLQRLASIHNLRFMSMLMERLRKRAGNHSWSRS